MVRKLLKFAGRLLIWFLGITVFWVIALRVIPPPLTPLMVIRMWEHVIEGKSPVLRKDWVSYKNISPKLVSAVIAAEDQKFPVHNGFDVEAMKKAYNHNAKLRKGKVIKGGSTITQQTAKNVFLWQGRSYLRKGFEAYFTFLIELFWGKKRIMEMYLNVIEMGDGIYGAEIASKTYFKKPASKLNSGESALLAAVLPNPRKWNAAKPSGYILRRQSWILRNMNNLGTDAL
jgi:monofunctional glycosyltransferase